MTRREIREMLKGEKLLNKKTSQRRDSLVDSITIAKTVLDGHAKNKQFEKKASERRRVIKQCSSAPGPSTGENKRRLSFSEELQTGCSVIAPNQANVPQADQANDDPTAQIIADDKKRDSRNAERRKIIKQKTSQRRDSLVDSITIAKTVLDGHAKNKQFEKKASERRRVIKTV
ncbi:hypothetical protein OS493_034767 [Desmophyllum pertusum]|uniref:Uncharacterized protein n=1 Tax=Desmophyllum pertusum TaxID=174260 RepID=A0A9X0CQR5_9CNID|nr:hypothetical protein OS493_034767 [Desmophyllum pertusum]